jgi:hypothetical protein
MEGKAKSPEPAKKPADPAGVRFLLRELVAEVEIERAVAARGMEKLDRQEIRKLIREKGDRRVRQPK